VYVCFLTVVIGVLCNDNLDFHKKLNYLKQQNIKQKEINDNITELLTRNMEVLGLYLEDKL